MQKAITLSYKALIFIEEAFKQSDDRGVGTTGAPGAACDFSTHQMIIRHVMYLAMDRYQRHIGEFVVLLGKKKSKLWMKLEIKQPRVHLFLLEFRCEG